MSQVGGGMWVTEILLATFYHLQIGSNDAKFSNVTQIWWGLNLLIEGRVLFQNI